MKMLPSFFLRVWITSHPSYHWLDRAPRLHPCPPWSSRQALTQTCDAALERERRYIGHFRQAQGSQAVLVSKLLDHKENRLQEHVPIDVIYFKSRQVIGIKDVFCFFFLIFWSVNEPLKGISQAVMLQTERALYQMAVYEPSHPQILQDHHV